MAFLGVYRALYDYIPQAEGELAIGEGDLLYVLEKSTEDDWWKAKKKAAADDDDEPTGLVPNNYVQEATPVGRARTLFEYERQTDEELSFGEDATLDVFDTSDPDWILVGLSGEYGFVPANYIEIQDGDAPDEPSSAPAPPSLPTRPPVIEEPIPTPPLPERSAPTAADTSSPPEAGPAAALAGVLAARSAAQPASQPGPTSPPAAPAPPAALPRRSVYVSEGASEDDLRSPPLPARPRGESAASELRPVPRPSLPHIKTHQDYDQPAFISPGGYHMYNINEMVSVMGKRKKMPTTLGINLGTGTILISPERAQDGPSQEWTAEKMTHYSREGKHVFLELVRPSKSVDFHAGAKDTAEEIVGALGELAGAVKAEGLLEVIKANPGQGQKKGQVLYDFMAQGDDEVTVAIGDEVLVLDDTKSEEWWQVRRLKNGKEGVVPSSYIEVTGVVEPSSSTAGLNAGKSTVEQNRLEEARLTLEAVRRADQDASRQEVGPGVPLPRRGSSLSAGHHGNNAGQRSKRENGGSSSRTKSKPDASKVRTWNDRSKSFSVEAQFLGIKDGKLNLHKMNGVKIAVPVAKMSHEDLEYVERVTGLSLDEDRPLSDVKKSRGAKQDSAKVGASIEQPKKPEYDWFQFFLGCEVQVGLCERYAQAFARDSMDESVLPDVDAGVLRTLGLREGDIIKVMRYLDSKYARTGRKKGVSFAGEDGGEDAGGLFSGPGGALRNNTRKGRPAPAVQTNDVVDAKAFSQQKDNTGDNGSARTPTPTSATNSGGQKPTSGFDDDAWDVKPSKQPPAEQKQPSAAAARPATEASPSPITPKSAQPLSGSMQELSLLTQPLEPTKTQATPAPAPAPAPAPVQQPAQTQPPAQQLPGASPGFFTQLAQQQTGLPNGQANQAAAARQRPAAPQYNQAQGGLVPPPPSRPLSAPQSAQPSAFAPPPLQPQMTGNPAWNAQQQIAPPGQSLNDINQSRMQQQFMQQQQQQQPQQFMPQPTGMGPFNPQGMQPQQTGFGQNQFVQQQGPFADPRQSQFAPSMQPQPTGMGAAFNPGQGFINPQATGVNSFLPPALEPQRTGMSTMQMQPQQTGFSQGGFNQGFGQQQPNGQQQTPMAPLQPQQTGPAPPVRFGVQPKPLAPQPTGRANLSKATPQNPFGF